MRVGDVLSAFYGGAYFAQRIKPVRDNLIESAAALLQADDAAGASNDEPLRNFVALIDTEWPERRFMRELK
jgi:hypothetical protein